MLIGRDPFEGCEAFIPYPPPPPANIPRRTMGSTAKFVETITSDSVISRGVVRPSAKDTETFLRFSMLSVATSGLKG